MGAKGGLFRYADKIDKLLMLVGTLGCIGDGLLTPLIMYTLSKIMNEYATSETGDALTLSVEIVDKYSLRLVFVAIVVGTSAFLGMYRASMLSLPSLLMHILSKILWLSAFVATLVVSFSLSWRLAVATMPFVIMFIIPGVTFGKLLMHIGTIARESYAVAGGIAEQAISSIRTVYSYVGENQTLDRYENALQNNMKLGIKQGLAKGLLIGSMGMIYAAWGFLAWVGSVLVTERGENGGAVFVSGTCVILSGVSIMNVLPNISSISEAAIAAARIQRMIDQVPGISFEDGKGKILAYFRGEIQFKDVEFSYPSRPDTPILRGFNLKVQEGKTVGLVGGSGSGKSTIISLLERFYDPISGSIYLDGYKINRLQLQWLRSKMGLVNQEPVLFATSIKENILFGKEEASMPLIVQAAKAANAHDFILKLPVYMQTPLKPLVKN